jgi:nucleoside-diphosphate-sugar epimerase
MNKRAFVTGATGFVGQHLVSGLVERGASVIALVRKPTRLGVETIVGDLGRDDPALAAALAGCDVVFHCAGAVGDRVTWASGHAVNVEGTRRIAEAARRAGVPRFVHVSTLGVYGVDAGTYSERSPRKRVDEPYTDTKIEAEETAERIFEGDALRIVRPGMIYGPNDTGMMPRLAEMIRKRVPLIGNGRTPVTLVHVRDVVAALVAAALSEHGGVWNVRGPDDLTWEELARRVAGALGVRAPKHMPKPVAALIARVLELLERVRLVDRAPLSPFVVKLLTCERHYTIDRLEALDGRPVVGIGDGLPPALAALARA